MKNCILEHCENAGANREINFTLDDTGKKFFANVPMCDDCYALVWRGKRIGSKLHCDVLFRPSHTNVNFDGVRHVAIVESMRLKA